MSVFECVCARVYMYDCMYFYLSPSVFRMMFVFFSFFIADFFSFSPKVWIVNVIVTIAWWVQHEICLDGCIPSILYDCIDRSENIITRKSILICSIEREADSRTPCELQFRIANSVWVRTRKCPYRLGRLRIDFIVKNEIRNGEKIPKWEHLTERRTEKCTHTHMYIYARIMRNKKKQNTHRSSITKQPKVKVAMWNERHLLGPAQ